LSGFDRPWRRPGFQPPSSSLVLPISARAIGDVTEMLPSNASASDSPPSRDTFSRWCLGCQPIPKAQVAALKLRLSICGATPLPQRAKSANIPANKTIEKLLREREVRQCAEEMTGAVRTLNPITKSSSMILMLSGAVFSRALFLLAAARLQLGQVAAHLQRQLRLKPNPASQRTITCR